MEQYYNEYVRSKVWKQCHIQSTIHYRRSPCNCVLLDSLNLLAFTDYLFDYLFDYTQIHFIKSLFEFARSYILQCKLDTVFNTLQIVRSNLTYNLDFL